MSKIWDGLSDEAKLICIYVGYTGVCVGICYVMYKWLCAMFAKSLVTELIKAGVITVL